MGYEAKIENVIASPRKAGEAISAVGQTINEEGKNWERIAKYKQGTEIAFPGGNASRTSLTRKKTGE
jgi:hypothetical protein